MGWNEGVELITHYDSEAGVKYMQSGLSVLLTRRSLSHATYPSQANRRWLLQVI